MLESLFLNPFMLIGLSAFTLPLIIEWLFRRRRRTVELPTLRHLLKHKNQKKIRRQDRLLMFLRCLACFLVALAVARPVLRPDATSTPSRHVIVILDLTASMNQQVGVATAFGLARKRAAEMLRQLPEGTRASVAMLTHHLEVLAEDTNEPQGLAAQVEGLRPTEGAAPVTLALNWAEELANKLDVTGADAYLFSDFQKYTWARGPEENGRAAEAFRKLNARCETVLIDVGGKLAYNFLVTRLAPRDPILSAGLPVTFDAQIETRGEVPEGVHPLLTLLVDGEKKDAREPDGAGRATFEVRFPGPGEYLVSAELEGDDHRIDNRRVFLCRVPVAVPVLVLDETCDRDGYDRASFFLERAIAPPVKPGWDPVSRFEVKLQHPAKAAYENFGQYAAVLLPALSQLDEKLARKLQQYVEDGGAVCVFAGPNLNVYEYNKHLYCEGKGLLPCAYEAAGSVEQIDKYELTFAGSRHPAGALLATGAASAPFKLSGFMPLNKRDDGSQPLELAQATNSAESKNFPVIVERKFGRGRVVQFGIGADTTFCPLPASTEFALLMQELLRHQIGSPDAAVNLQVGQRFEQPVKVSAQHLLLKGPDGLRARLTPRKVAGEETWLVQYDETTRAGLYEVDTIPEAMDRRRFAVNLSPEEGDLERLDADGVATALASHDWRWLGPEQSLAATIAQRHGATELALHTLFILGLVLAAESFLAARFGRRRTAPIPLSKKGGTA